MKVAVASQNPVKLAAAQAAFIEYFKNDAIEIIGVQTDSGVADQPMTLEETITGAYNRMRQLSAQADAADYVVGIEGGLVTYKGSEAHHAFTQDWACVGDTKTGLYEIAAGPHFPIPPHVVRHMEAGKTLTEAMKIEYGIQDIGKNKGYIGWLSNEHFTRTSTAQIGIYLALCGLLKEK